jgi:hypothetical protein
MCGPTPPERQDQRWANPVEKRLIARPIFSPLFVAVKRARRGDGGIESHNPKEI